MQKNEYKFSHSILVYLLNLVQIINQIFYLCKYLKVYKLIIFIKFIIYLIIFSLTVL